MKGPLRSSWSFWRRFLVLVLLPFTVVSHVSWKVNGGDFRVDEKAEFQRSMARCRSTIENDHPDSKRDLLQVGEEMKNAGQAAGKRDAEGFVFPEPFLLKPTIKNWDEQRGSWLAKNPHMKAMPDGKPRVLIVSGSQPKPCASSLGDWFHVRSLKQKIDYARMHNYEIFYNFALLETPMTYYWAKLPIVRKLMLTHPEIEWFIWVDSDAFFTDVLFEPPFHTYDRDGYNMVMWSWKEGFYKNKDWIAVNVGVFIIRNCQWSLDLFDKWSPMGPEGPVRDAYGRMLSKFLKRYDNYPADDQSALVYLMLTDESVMSKIKLVEYEYIISGWWVDVVDTFDNSIEKFHPGLGDRRWPWITHFTGCTPCSGGDHNAYTFENCMFNITRALNFADNQVLAYMGYQHQNLSSPVLIRTREETDRPLDFVGVNPWQKKIDQLAAETAQNMAAQNSDVISEVLMTV